MGKLIDLFDENGVKDQVEKMDKYLNDMAKQIEDMRHEITSVRYWRNLLVWSIEHRNELNKITLED